MIKDKVVNYEKRRLEAGQDNANESTTSKEEPKVTCPVCGHPNKISNGHCEMCSMYLF